MIQWLVDYFRYKLSYLNHYMYFRRNVGIILFVIVGSIVFVSFLASVLNSARQMKPISFRKIYEARYVIFRETILLSMFLFFFFTFYRDIDIKLTYSYTLKNMWIQPIIRWPIKVLKTLHIPYFHMACVCLIFLAVVALITFIFRSKKFRKFYNKDRNQRIL